MYGKKIMGVRKKAVLTAASLLSMTAVAVRPADAVATCALTTGEVVAVLTTPSTGVTCSFDIVRSGVQAVTLTMQSTAFATARVRLNGATCAVVSGVSGAATGFCPTFGALGRLELTMSSSAVSAQATLLNVPLP